MRRLALFACIAAVAAGVALWARQLARDSPERMPAWMQAWPSVYLNLALKHIRDKSVAPAATDWPAVAARARQEARRAKTTADTYPAIWDALASIGDDAGGIYPPAAPIESTGAYGLQVLFPERTVATVFPQSSAETAGVKPGDRVELVDGRQPVQSVDPRTRGRFIDLPRPKTQLRIRRGDADPMDVALEIGSLQPLPANTGRVGTDLGFVSLPATTGDGEFTQRVREAIAATDAPALCGWIVDLRRNNGGALWPTLNALQAILGNETVGFFVRRDGGKMRWDYPPKDAAAAAVKPIARPDAPVAILTSAITANAGEWTTIAFRGRPLTRVFGEPTWGASALRVSVTLPDKATLDLSTALAADRTGQTYEGPLTPDEPAVVDWGRLGTPGDPTIIAAATWIRAQPGCGKGRRTQALGIRH